MLVALLQLNAAIAGFERDKLELEQYRSKQLHRLVKENSARMAKLEEEHSTQNMTNVSLLDASFHSLPFPYLSPSLSLLFLIEVNKSHSLVVATL